MNNQYTKGTPINVIWFLKRPDGAPYSLAGYQHVLKGRNSRGAITIDSSVVNYEQGYISFVLTEDMQTSTGLYSFSLDLYMHGQVIDSIVANDIIEIVRERKCLHTCQLASRPIPVTEIISVGQFNLFAPSAPVAGSDGYWYFNGERIKDDEGNDIPTNFTLDIVTEGENAGRIIINQGRYNEVVVDNLKEALGKSAADHERAEQDHDIAVQDRTVTVLTIPQSLSEVQKAQARQNIGVQGGGGDSHPYLSLERLRKYLYRVSFDRLPEDNGGDNLPIGGCSSFVADGKLYSNLDWDYDNTASFIVRTKDFEGQSFVQGMDDGNLIDVMIAQLPYRVHRGVNNYGIKVAAHVLYNDWEWTGAGNKSINLTRLPFLVLTRVKSMATIASDLSGVLDNLCCPEGLAELGYLLQILVTDGTISYALLPPTEEGQAYVLQNITSNPKLANFRWVSRSTVERTDADIQTRPTGVERFNLMPCPLDNLRFTKAYESPDRLSEFIGLRGTTKDSTDAQLEAIYTDARAEYLTRERDGKTWQTMESVVYGDRMESLWIQENWGDNCVVGVAIPDGSVTAAKLADSAVTKDKLATAVRSLLNYGARLASPYIVSPSSQAPEIDEGEIFVFAAEPGTYSNFPIGEVFPGEVIEIEEDDGLCILHKKFPVTGVQEWSKFVLGPTEIPDGSVSAAKLAAGAVIKNKLGTSVQDLLDYGYRLASPYVVTPLSNAPSVTEGNLFVFAVQSGEYIHFDNGGMIPDNHIVIGADDGLCLLYRSFGDGLDYWHKVELGVGGGSDGHSPYIGENGNWFEWSSEEGDYVDTEIAAQGPQGNTGSSVEYPFELVNNLATNDATKALSAAMGKELKDKTVSIEAQTLTTAQKQQARNNIDAASTEDISGMQSNIHNIQSQIGNTPTTDVVLADTTTVGGYYTGEIGETASLTSSSSYGNAIVVLTSAIDKVDYYCRMVGGATQVLPHYLLFCDDNLKILGKAATAEAERGYYTFENILVPAGTTKIIMMDWSSTRSGRLTVKTYKQIVPIVQSLYGKDVFTRLNLRYILSTEKYGAGQGLLIKVDKGDVLTIRFSEVLQSSILGFFTDTIPVSGATASLLSSYYNFKNKSLGSFRVPNYNSNTIYYFISATTLPDGITINLNGIEVDPYFDGNDVLDATIALSKSVKSLDYDLSLKIGSFVSGSDTSKAITANNLPGKCRIELNDGYVFSRIQHVDFLEGTNETKTIGRTFGGHDLIKKVFTTNYEGYVKFEFAKDDGTSFTTAELTGVIKSYEVLDDANIIDAVKHSAIPYSHFVRENCVLIGKDARDFLLNADYADDPNYTESAISTYWNHFDYERPLPVRIHWTPIDNVREYQVVWSTITGGSISPSAPWFSVPHDQNWYDFYNLIPASNYAYMVIAVMMDGTVQGIEYGSFSTDPSCKVRMIHMPNVVNARDLGGWTAGNTTVKYGKLFRSAAISRTQGHIINAEGREIACRLLGITMEIGLGVGYEHSPISQTTKFEDIPVGAYYNGVTTSAAKYVEILQKINAELQVQYSDVENGVVLFHCAGGADRTGTLSWLLLGLLGVNESDLSKEYEFTSFQGAANQRLRTTGGIKEVAEYIHTYEGATLQDKIEAWFLSNGATASDISTFRNLMLD